MEGQASIMGFRMLLFSTVVLPWTRKVSRPQVGSGHIRCPRMKTYLAGIFASFVSNVHG